MSGTQTLTPLTKYGCEMTSQEYMQPYVLANWATNCTKPAVWMHIPVSRNHDVVLFEVLCMLKSPRIMRIYMYIHNYTCWHQCNPINKIFKFSSKNFAMVKPFLGLGGGRYIQISLPWYHDIASINQCYTSSRTIQPGYDIYTVLYATCCNPINNRS